MYLAFKNLKISIKNSERSSESQEQSTNNDFPGENATRLGSLMEFQVKLQKSEEVTYSEGRKQQAMYSLT